MKTIEQKAKRYDETLDRAKKELDACGSQDCDAARLIFRLFPELKESEDERMKKALIDYFKWNPDTQLLNEFSNREVFAWLEKQGEQKPADKVEPKFKIGDWVVLSTSDGEKVVQIDSIEYFKSGEPRYITSEGKWFGNRTEAHLWTIQDTKDGDVLSDGTTIFIFKDLLSDGSVMSYCDYDTDSGESDAFCTLSMNLMCSKITPATKEQRDTLMKAMADAGYTFDFEKKELRKIEQKPAWSEEDLNKYDFAIRAIGLCKQYAINNQINGYSKLPDTPQRYEELLSWFKSLKDRVQPKQEWSEEDEKKLLCICAWIKDYPRIADFTDEMYTVANNYIDWLKSLRPQYRWKPSDEQMNNK